MSHFAATLSSRQLGCEVLVHLARQRLSGTLQVSGADPSLALTLREGRPEATDAAASGREAVVAALRQVAVRTAGRCQFVAAAGGGGAAATSLNIDTLGECLVALQQLLPDAQVAALLAARAALPATATPLYGRLVRAVQGVGGAPLAAAPAVAGTAPLSTWVAGAGAAEARAWAAVLLLGGLQAGEPGAGLEPATPAAAAAAGPAAAAPAAAQVSAAAAAPAPPPGSVAAQIVAAHTAAATQDHYAYLGVAADAPADAIRRAYFELAKRWHADRLVGAGLTDDVRGMAQALFVRAEEANRVLCDEGARKDYDWVLMRQAQGLPTDAKSVLEAEGLFRRGETLVRRGQAAAAEAVLRQAVALNRGEAEYWAYLGFAIYGAHAAAGVAEARECLAKAMQMRDKLEAAHEFLGRICRAEGDQAGATQNLQAALAINPRNVAAERELRLMSMRREQEGRKPGLGGALGRLFKK